MSIIRKFQRQLARSKDRGARDAIQSLPKPPVIDGVCACGCVHVPDRGACPKYHKGSNSRCVFCDHSVLCHRRKGERPPTDWNFPVKFPPNWLGYAPPDWGKQQRYVVCGHCLAPGFACQECKTVIPIKQVVDDEQVRYHTGTCPKCGAVDEVCPGPKKDEL